MFRRNIGGIDRVLRVALGSIFLIGGLVLLSGATRLGIVLIVVGTLALLTGIVRFCVLYIPFGFSTARPEYRPLSQVCDCSAWMKAMQDNRATARRAPKEEEVAPKV